MPGWGFLFLIFPVIVGFVLALTLNCFKPLRFLSIYAFLIPPLAGWGSWGGLISVTSLHLKHLVYFDQHSQLATATFLLALGSGGFFGAVAAVAIGFALSWMWRHAG
jgi:hypothetical protein